METYAILLRNSQSEKVHGKPGHAIPPLPPRKIITPVRPPTQRSALNITPYLQNQVGENFSPTHAPGTRQLRRHLPWGARVHKKLPYEILNLPIRQLFYALPIFLK